MHQVRRDPRCQVTKHISKGKAMDSHLYSWSSIHIKNSNKRAHKWELGQRPGRRNSLGISVLWLLSPCTKGLFGEVLTSLQHVKGAYLNIGVLDTFIWYLGRQSELLCSSCLKKIQKAKWTVAFWKGLLTERSLKECVRAFLWPKVTVREQCSRPLKFYSRWPFGG